MNYFIVNQNRDYKEERELGIIRARKFNKSGRTDYHHANMTRVKPGDVIFHRVKGEIVAISTAKASAEDIIWHKDGKDLPAWKIPCEYTILDEPIKLKDYSERIVELKSSFQSAFNASGKGQQGYLFFANPKLAVFLLSLSSY